MKPTQHEKVLAITSYLWFIGLIIAFFLNKDNKSKFVTAHIKNMFGLIILWLIAISVNAYIHVIIGEFLFLFSIALWLISIFNAFRGKVIVFPYFTEKFEKWFKFLD